MGCVLLYLYNSLIPYSLFCRRVDFGFWHLCVGISSGALFFLTIMRATCFGRIFIARNSFRLSAQFAHFNKRFAKAKSPFLLSIL